MNESIAWWRRNPKYAYLIAIGLAVVPLAAFIFGAHGLLKREVTKRLVVQGSRSGKMLAALVERSPLENESFLSAFVARPDVLTDWQRGNTLELAAILARAHALRRDFAAIGLYDKDGVVRAVSPNGARLFGDDRQETDLYRRVQTSNSAQVSHAYRLTSSSPYVVSIAVPIRDQQGVLAGMAVGQQTLDTVAHDVYAFSTPESNALLFVVDNSGQIFGKQGSGFTLVPANRAIVERLARAGHGDTGQQLRLGTQEVIAAYVPITSLGWGMLVSVPIQVIDDPLWRAERQFGIFGAILMLLASGIGFAVVTRLQRFRNRQLLYREHLEAARNDSKPQSGSAPRNSSSARRAISISSRICSTDSLIAEGDRKGAA